MYYFTRAGALQLSCFLRSQKPPPELRPSAKTFHRLFIENCAMKKHFWQMRKFRRSQNECTKVNLAHLKGFLPHF